MSYLNRPINGPFEYGIWRDHRSMERPPAQPVRGFVLALASAAVLSTTAILIRHITLSYRLPPLALAFWRDLLAAGVLGLVLAWRRPEQLILPRRHIPFLLCFGLILALFNALWTFSVVLNGAAVATVLVYCSTGFTVLLGRWWFNERLGRGAALAVFLALVGCLLISRALDQPGGPAREVGVWIGVGAGLGYALYTLAGREAWRCGLSPWTSLLFTFGLAAAFLAAIGWLIAGIFGGESADLICRELPPAGWGWLFLLAAGPTVAGFGLYNASLEHLPAGVVNLVVTLEPVFTAVLAGFCFGERLSGGQVGGALLIMTGILVVRWGKPPVQPLPPAEENR